jgi:hypothetical protein
LKPSVKVLALRLCGGVRIVLRHRRHGTTGLCCRHCGAGRRQMVRPVARSAVTRVSGGIGRNPAARAARRNDCFRELLTGREAVPRHRCSGRCAIGDAATLSSPLSRRLRGDKATSELTSPGMRQCRSGGCGGCGGDCGRGYCCFWLRFRVRFCRLSQPPITLYLWMRTDGVAPWPISVPRRTAAPGSSRSRCSR